MISWKLYTFRITNNPLSPSANNLLKSLFELFDIWLKSKWKLFGLCLNSDDLNFYLPIYWKEFNFAAGRGEGRLLFGDVASRSKDINGSYFGHFYFNHIPVSSVLSANNIDLLEIGCSLARAEFWRHILSHSNGFCLWFSF